MGCASTARRCVRRQIRQRARRTCLLLAAAWFGSSMLASNELSSYEFVPGAGNPLPNFWSAASPRRPLVFRNRVMEPSGFAQETLDFVTAMQHHFYIAIQDDGKYDRGAVKARTVASQKLLARLAAPERLQFVQQQAHIQVHLGAAGDFNCQQVNNIPKYCVGRTTFETDRIPADW